MLGACRGLGFGEPINDRICFGLGVQSSRSRPGARQRTACWSPPIERCVVAFSVGEWWTRGFRRSWASSRALVGPLLDQGSVAWRSDGLAVLPHDDTAADCHL